MPTLKELRRAKGLTQMGLAELVGVPFRTIQKYEAGNINMANVTLEKAVKLAQALGIRPEELLEPGKGGSNGADTPQLLPHEDLADIFAYCAHISRLVSPRQAMTYFNFTYDGSVADTFYGLSMLYAGEGAARSADDFKKDELYGPTLQQMLKDIREILEYEEE
ncbi:MAG: helix-turn-helix transcriptional regulator [Clostridia bacterium]|nr:helix-turn-helix transcriptional regulator [Clostridia bacterium]